MGWNWFWSSLPIFGDPRFSWNTYSWNFETPKETLVNIQKFCDPIVLVYSYTCIVELNLVVSIKIRDTELIIFKKDFDWLILSLWLWYPIFSGHGFFLIRALTFDEILVHKNSKKISFYFIFAKIKVILYILVGNFLTQLSILRLPLTKTRILV